MERFGSTDKLIYTKLSVKEFVGVSDGEVNLGRFIDFLRCAKIDIVNIYTDFKRISSDMKTFDKDVSDMFYHMLDFLEIFTQVVHRYYEKLLTKESHVDRVIDKIYELSEHIILLSKDKKRMINTYAELFDYLNVCMWGLEKISKELFLIENVKTNLNNQNLHIFGQGIFDSHGNLWEREVLTRMTDFKGEMINPNEFLKVIHSTIDMKSFNLVHKLDWGVIETTFEYFSTTDKVDSFSINLNPGTLQEKGFLARLRNLIKRYNINPKKIIFEILEYQNIQDPDIINRKFKTLKELGFKIAIDDYPEGYNTLNQLLKLKYVDIVKLDGDFVMKTFNKCVKCKDMQSCLSLLNRTIDVDDVCLKRVEEDYDLETFINSLKFVKILYPDIRIFAENVENKDVYDFLLATRMIDGYQGYYDILEKPRVLHKGITSRNREKELYNILNHNIEKLYPEEKIEVEKFFSSEFGDILSNDILESSVTMKFSEILVKFLSYIGLDKISFYVRNGNDIIVKTVRDNISVELKKIKYDSEQSRIPKEYANLYKVLNNLHNLSLDGFLVAEGGIAEEGDDICIKVNDQVIIGFDEESYAKNNFTDLQRYLMLSLVRNIKRIVQEK